jgi:hypothetical protein
VLTATITAIAINMLFIRVLLVIFPTLKPSTFQGIAKPTAKHAASDLAFGKEVTIQTHGKDKYKRTLVKDGWCYNTPTANSGMSSAWFLDALHMPAIIRVENIRIAKR